MKWEAKYNKFLDIWRVKDEEGNIICLPKNEQTAKLIAAAPEMLDLLKNIADCEKGSWMEEEINKILNNLK